ncbi:hypothetical protein [Gordonia caeni]|uniref:hypothetical protein n=1 Tax=Gordonia caeni TaxID=1007097 RepID=UPI0031D98DDE
MIRELRGHADRIPDLHLRVAPVWRDLAYPRWCTAAVGDGQFRHHRGPRTWDECRAAVADLLTEGLDPTVHSWRVHLFGPVTGAPRASGPATVAVVQISHALADGRGASDLARALLGGTVPETAAVPGDPPGAVAAMVGAAEVPLRLVAAFGLGLVAWRRAGPEPAESGPEPLPATVLNRRPGPLRRVDLVVTDAELLRLGDASITVSVLAVLAQVLTDFLPDADPALAVELTLARSDGFDHSDVARNRFHTAGVRLYPDLAPDARAQAIAAEITDARRRDETPARRADRRAAAVTPPVLRAFAARVAANAPAPDRVTGVTVVSSVNRGPADFRLAGGDVLFTAGFPALSAVHAMTIGVHGLGGTVTISVTTDPAAVDADRFVRVLRSALGRSVVT